VYVTVSILDIVLIEGANILPSVTHKIAVCHIWQPDCLVKMQALCFVLGTGKNLTDQDVLVLPMDVTAIDQLEFHFQQVIEHFGKVKIPLYILVSYLYSLRLKYLSL